MDLMQNQIAGRQIATAVAIWDEDSGYVFIGEGLPGTGKGKGRTPKYTVERSDLVKRNVSLVDIMDCVKQLEELGSPLMVRDFMGLQPYGGHYDQGIVIRSRTNENVSCNVTTNSGRNEAGYDVALQWYFDEDNVAGAPNDAFMDEYWRLTGGDRPPSTPLTPVAESDERSYTAKKNSYPTSGGRLEGLKGGKKKRRA